MIDVAPGPDKKDPPPKRGRASKTKMTGTPAMRREVSRLEDSGRNTLEFEL
jgi:hypothetical protein